MPQLTLQPVGRHNWESVIDLSLVEGQDKFVALNAESLAESKFYSYYVDRAIYLDDKVIGFAQYHPMAPEGEAHLYYITQFMIDQAYQGKGYGDASLALLIAEISSIPQCQTISAFYVSGHDRMQAFFQRLGFHVAEQDAQGTLMKLQVESPATGVFLVPVDETNYDAVCDLEVSPQQEDYVASNLWSLVEAGFNDNHTTRVIMHHNESMSEPFGEPSGKPFGEPVGFLMWVQERPGYISIWRFMVDKNHQNQGIGRQALTLALDHIKKTPSIHTIEICYNPNNPVAKDFYSSFGFVEQGMDDDGDDMIAVLPVAGRRNR